MNTHPSQIKQWEIHISNNHLGFKGETFHLTNDQLTIMTANYVFCDLIEDTKTDEIMLSISAEMDGK